MIEIEKKDDVYVKVKGDPSDLMELSDYFTFKVPGYNFTPAYRAGRWNGDIKLFNALSGLLYYGLAKRVEEFCKSRNYTFVSKLSNAKEFSIVEAQERIDSFNLPKEINGSEFSVRDFQLKSFIDSIRNQRQLIISPTASGKSLIIYLIARFLCDMGGRVLIIVPTVNLVHQMDSDFASYNSNLVTQKIAGSTSSEKDIKNADVIITTWQSIYKLPQKWFENFQGVIGDEAHLFKAKSLISIMTKTVNCPYKIGFTGTLDGTQTHKYVLEGLFGPVNIMTTTKELQDKNILADLQIKIIVLNYADDIKRLLKTASYQEEIEFISSNVRRNKFLRNLVLSLKGNTLLLFRLVDKQGKDLYSSILDSNQKQVYYVDGSVSGEIREEIRNKLEKHDNAIIVASYGTTSTGWNVRNLHNIIFASPYKTQIKVLQSIGRGLRLHANKDSVVVFDIADDFRYKKHKNHGIKHLEERVKIYNREQFKYKYYTVDI